MTTNITAAIPQGTKRLDFVNALKNIIDDSSRIVYQHVSASYMNVMIKGAITPNQMTIIERLANIYSKGNYYF